MIGSTVRFERELRCSNGCFRVCFVLCVDKWEMRRFLRNQRQACMPTTGCFVMNRMKLSDLSRHFDMPLIIETLKIDNNSTIHSTSELNVKWIMAYAWNGVSKPSKMQTCCMYRTMGKQMCVCVCVYDGEWIELHRLADLWYDSIAFYQPA